MLANKQACHPTSHQSYSHPVLNDNPALRGKGKSRGKGKGRERGKSTEKKQNPARGNAKQVNYKNRKMSETKPKTKRKYKLHLRVPVEVEEGEAIKQQADKCGLSAAEYLRKLGLGYTPTSIIDNKKVAELAKINGDLGRLGGLLKLWLSDDRRAAHFDKKTINQLLKDIEQTRTQMTDIMMKIIRSK